MKIRPACICSISFWTASTPLCANAATWPSIEVLQYLAPADGRPAPRDTRANDLWYWQTRLVAYNAEQIVEQLIGGRYTFVSPGNVTLPDGLGSYHKGLMVQDPDGHAMQIVAP